MTGRMLEAIEQVLMKEKPDLAMVYGDTNSTIAGALAAAKLHTPVAHIEAGLRSFDRRMPEELNRVVTDHLSDLLLCPTEASVENLRNEGVVTGVHLVGDVMYDATLFARARGDVDAVLRRLGLSRGEYALCTLHRAENIDDDSRLEKLITWLTAQAATWPIIWPVHPRARAKLASRAIPNITMVDPLGYFDLQAVASGAGVIFTDSGGLQKEAYFHKVPCVTLRDNTEWVETVAAGWNRLWTRDGYETPKREIPEYGEGRAAEACVDALVQFLQESTGTRAKGA
jgi:UDP-GlcNAc3NAcA epimerase